MDRFASPIFSAVDRQFGGAILAQQFRPAEVTNALNPIAGKVDVAHLVAPAPGFVDGVKHYFPRPGILQHNQRQAVTIGAQMGGMFGQHARRGGRS